MKLFLDDDDLIEISPLDNIPGSQDRALTITPQLPRRGVDRSELDKEIIGIDAIEVGPTRAAEIHGVSINSARNYSQGKDVGPDAKSKILSKRYEVEDTAIMKLMDTLQLIDVREGNIKVERNKAQIANALSQIVDRMGSKGKNDKGNVVLHLHMPNQKKEEDYTVIDV